jgi:FkbM family methyltransferase
VISYAQNAEDVVLARVFPSPLGFYVDVGAADPDSASVTRHFYDLGWEGINIEPRVDAHARLVERRPRDINLRVAAGAGEGFTTLYRVEADPDLSTTNPDHLADLPPDRVATSEELVPMRSLDSILAEHADRPIDFLKIDVEGSEDAVLAGIDLQRWRPRVVVVEAVKPWRADRDEGWRHRLEESGYRAALFDGVNLFFAEEKDEEAVGHLVPASVLDDYETRAAVALRRELDAVRAYAAKLSKRLELRSGVAPGAVRQAMAEPLRATRPPAGLPDRPTVPPASPPTPPAAARVAVVGPPGVLIGDLARILAAALDAPIVTAAHPADVDWSGLPPRVVVELTWPRTRLLEKTLRAAGLTAVAPGGRPADPPASLALTTSWWSTPATCRVLVDDLTNDPVATVETVLAECGIDVPADLAGAVGRAARTEGGDTTTR